MRAGYCLCLLLFVAACKDPAPNPDPLAAAQAEQKQKTQEAAVTFEKWKIDQALDAFRAAGLEVGEVSLMAKPKDYGIGPTVALEGKRFLIPSLCADCGGRVFTYANEADLKQHKEYFDSFSRNSAALWSWTYTKDNILVQINGQLPEEKAKQYESALNSLK